jgi:uncharacterized protein YjdB
MPYRTLLPLAMLALLAGACSPTDDGTSGVEPSEDAGADAPVPDATSPDAEAPDAGRDAEDAGPPVVAAVRITPSNPTLELHKSLPLQAQPVSVEGDDLDTRPTEWSSSDADIVSVNEYGTIIANEIGQATVTATIEEVSGSVLVGVRGKPVAEVEVVPAQRTLEPGEQVELTVYLTDANGASIDDDRDIEFSSSAPEVATVSEDGLVTGLSSGDATITVEAEGEQATMAITVEATPTEVDRVELSSNYEQLIRGDAVALAATVYDDQGDELTGAPITWSSSSPPVATVDAGGYVEAVGEGSATIVATSGGKSATAVVDVTFSLSTIGVGDGFACGLIQEVAFCWGANDRGQLGRGMTSSEEALGRVSGDHAFASLTVGHAHACGVTAAGEAHCWGAGTDGQLGDASSDDRSSPTPVTGGHTFEALAAGPHHTCGIDQQGGALCWGLGDNGQLGDGASSSSTSPVAASGASFASIFVGASHTCAVTASNDAYCWGANDRGQLGTNDRVEKDQPAQVSGGYSYAALALADAHTCGVGSSACWGANDRGQLGEGTNNDHITPLLIPTPVALSRVTAGAEHTCALGGGTVYCWGANDSGQLGTGATTDRSEPTQVSSTRTFVDVAAGPTTTCALDDHGKPFCWGDLPSQTSPTPVPGF